MPWVTSWPPFPIANQSTIALYLKTWTIKFRYFCALKSLDKARSEGKRNISATDTDDYDALVDEWDDVQTAGMHLLLLISVLLLSFSPFFWKPYALSLKFDLSTFKFSNE